MFGGPWVGILCYLDLPTWITHTALAVNNHPLYSLYNPLHGPRVGTHALQRLYISTALYSPLQPSTSLHLYILYSIHPSTSPLRAYAERVVLGTRARQELWASCCRCAALYLPVQEQAEMTSARSRTGGERPRMVRGKHT